MIMWLFIYFFIMLLKAEAEAEQLSSFLSYLGEGKNKRNSSSSNNSSRSSRCQSLKPQVFFFSFYFSLKFFIYRQATSTIAPHSGMEDTNDGLSVAWTLVFSIKKIGLLTNTTKLNKPTQTTMPIPMQMVKSDGGISR